MMQFCRVCKLVAVSRFLDVDGLRVHYLDAGSGDAVVLIHGFTHSAERWRQTGLFDRLASRHRVVALDCRGHGLSDKPHDPARYADMYEDVIRILDREGLDRVHIVGYSMGAALAGRLLLRHPRRFLTATFVGATGRASQEGTERRRRMADDFERGDARMLVTAVWPTRDAPPTDAQLREASARTLAGNDPLALAAVLRAPVSIVTTEDLAGVAKFVPLLGVAGTADSALQALKDMQPSIPELTVVAIEGAGHTAVLSRPDLADTIERFIAAHS